MSEGYSPANEEGPCRALNISTMVVNTTDTASGTYVKVECIKGYQLSAAAGASSTAAQSDPHVFHCLDSFWNPHTPRCVEIDDGGVPVGTVVGCTIGGVVCLTVVLIAAYIMCRTRDEGQIEKQNDLLHKAKMMHLNFFMTSFQQDNVGMPAVTAESVDLDLRGVTSYDEPMTSYGTVDSGGKLYRSRGSVFGDDEDHGSDDFRYQTSSLERKTNSKC